MGKKRAHGEGSVYRDPRGFWRGAVTMPDGKRRYLSGRTRGEVAAKVQAAAVSSRRGELAPDAQTTLAAYLAAWLEIIRPTVRPWTWTGYESCLRTHVVPAIGRVKLLDLQPRHVSQVMAAMAAGGSAPSTVARVRSVLSTALAAAVRAGAIPRNAASLAPPPRQERARRAWLDAGQAATFLAACQGHPDGPILSLILLLGLRRGEAMALRWTDYSPERATLDVHRTVSSARGPRTENAPKTSAGRRTLPVPAPAAAILDAERRRQEAEGLWSPGGTCLLNRQGKPYNPPTLLKHLRALLQDAGLPSIRLHDLRHSTASILLEHGVAARVVADLLGHSSTAITLDLYSHVTARLVVSATDVMGALSPPIAAPPAAPMPPENADNPGGAGIVAAPPDDRIT